MKLNHLRLTRSSYKRKLIMFGVSIFTALALSATGFAAWVLSQDAKGTVDGNITVGAIDEANIAITNLAFTSGMDAFVFEPREDDEDGRVRNDGVNFESLTAEINWSLSNYQSVGEITVDLKLPASVKAAIDANYLALPAGMTLLTDASSNPVTETIEEKTYYVARYTIAAGLTASGNLTDGASTPNNIGEYTVTETDDIKNATFTLGLTFGWGSAFNYENPGVYFDTTAASADYNTVKSTLLTFKLMLHGVTYDATHLEMSEEALDAIYAANPIPNFQILVTAKVA